MKISDAQYGKKEIIEVRPSSADDFGTLNTLAEVNLYRAEMESEALLRAGEASWTVEGVDAHHQERLNTLLGRPSPRVAWVATRRPKGNNLPATSLIVEVREFQSQHIWPEPVDLGVDEKIVEVVRKKRKSLSTTSDVITWLQEQVLITGAEGVVPRSPVRQSYAAGGSAERISAPWERHRCRCRPGCQRPPSRHTRRGGQTSRG